MKSTFPEYKSTTFKSSVENFSSSSNFKATIELIISTAVSLDSPASKNCSTKETVALLSLPASGPDPIPSLSIVTYEPPTLFPKL